MDKKWYESDWIYDLESYPNCFSMCIVHASGKSMRVFEISDRKNDIEGIVFHDSKSDKMCKIRKCDFGIKRLRSF